MENKIKYICNAVKWFDKVNGNTYHSARITRTADGETIACPFEYGYGDQYRYTALEGMRRAGWITAEPEALYKWERENNYPVLWNVSQGLKRECIANGII